MSLSLLRRGGNGNKWRERFHQQLEDLKKLPPGSDSWSPHCPLSDVLTAAREIGEDVGRRGLFVSIVAATSDGGIQLKWKTRTGNCHFSYILIEVWSICSSIAKLISVKVANSRMSRKRAISSA